MLACSRELLMQNNDPLVTQYYKEIHAHRLTQEALLDVDTGNVIDHQMVQAWADNLDIPN